MKKGLLLSNVPTPYLTPLFNRLAGEQECRMEICYTACWNTGAGWSERQAYDYDIGCGEILSRRFKLVGKLSPQIAATLALGEKLLRRRFDYLLIYGYTRLPQLSALLWCVFTQTPFVLAGDAAFYADETRGLKRWLKRHWLGFLASYATAIAVAGRAGGLFWEAYGARPEKILVTPFAVNNDFWAAESNKQLSATAAFRREQGWHDKTIFLFVGRLIERKNVDLLIGAALALKDRAVLLVVGEGPEHPALEKLAADDPCVGFIGNVSQQALPFYYALADVLVLPARAEPWGLVVNEAMACGLAVIAHQHCGAALDLLNEENGIELKTFSLVELTEAMRRLSDDVELRCAMQMKSREKIQAWSLDTMLQGLKEAIEKAAAHERKTNPPAVPK